MASWYSTAVDGFRLAVGTLTRFPVTAPRVVEAPQIRAAVWWFVPVSLVLVLLPVGLGWGLITLGTSSFASATVTVASLAWLSRGLHWDGLADTADGLHVSWDRQRALKVMRASDIGPMGVLAILFAALLQVLCLADLWGQHFGLVVAVVALGRCLLGLACGVSRAAQPDGLGAGFFQACSLLRGSLVALVTGGLFAAVAALTGAGLFGAAVTFAVALAAVVIVCQMTQRAIDGSTGDTLGAAVEVATAAALLAAATVW